MPPDDPSPVTTDPFNECPHCGALIINPDKHDKWHRHRNDELVSLGAELASLGYELHDQAVRIYDLEIRFT